MVGGCCEAVTVFPPEPHALVVVVDGGVCVVVVTMTGGTCSTPMLPTKWPLCWLAFVDVCTCCFVPPLVLRPSSFLLVDGG